MAAKKKQIAIQTLDSLGLSAEDLKPRVSVEADDSASIASSGKDP